MSKIHFYLCVGCFLALFSCKQEGKVNAEGGQETTIEFPFNVTKGGGYQSIALIRGQMEAMIDRRTKDNPRALSIITQGFWNPEFVFNEKMSEPDEYVGIWIDFKDDFSYEYGLFEEIYGSGRYHFDMDQQTLIVLDDQDGIEPKAWQVQHNGQAMALVGSHELGINNGMQMKLLLVDNKPKKG